MSLRQLGWNFYFEALWKEAAREHRMPARVVSQQRNLWRIAGDFGERWAEPSGKLRLASGAGGPWPAVGDWVAAELPAGSQTALLQEVLPRRSAFLRKAAGKGLESQVVAANVDTALLLTGLDGDFNLRRLERYLAQSWESGAQPVIVLNKTDLCPDVYTRIEGVERVSLGAPVLALSALSGEGLQGLAPFLSPGRTLVLLGSSGVGKSTLVNRLLGRDAQSVQPVRARRGRGRHTTTARQLFHLPGGAMVIDTPGLRELHLWDAEEGLSSAFGEIESLAAQCRFGNCRHEAEPGCAVRRALTEGALDPARLENLRKLEREQAFLRRKQDPAARASATHRVKQIERAMRERSRLRRKELDRS